MTNSSNHWSNYWKGGNLTSLPQDFLENYEGEIAEFWKNSFSRLNPESSILDLCTGNGAIALLASIYSTKNNYQFSITGIDAAKVDKKNIIAKYLHIEQFLQNIQIIDQCQMEEISLTAESFDLITSQYGVEYCNWQKAAIKVSQLLKKEGRFVMICHAHSTAISTYMRQEEKDYSVLFKLGFFSSISNFHKGKNSHRETIRILKKILTVIVDLDKINSSDLFRAIHSFIEQIIALEKNHFKQLEDKILDFCNQHLYAYERLKDVVSVSNKIKEEPDWYRIFESEGLKLLDKGDILQSGSHNAGAFYIFSKS